MQWFCHSNLCTGYYKPLTSATVITAGSESETQGLGGSFKGRNTSSSGQWGARSCFSALSLPLFEQLKRVDDNVDAEMEVGTFAKAEIHCSRLSTFSCFAPDALCTPGLPHAHVLPRSGWKSSGSLSSQTGEVLWWSLYWHNPLQAMGSLVSV